jgi:hypothetical protein
MTPTSVVSTAVFLLLSLILLPHAMVTGGLPMARLPATGT